jgi:hypothetical protein
MQPWLHVVMDRRLIFACLHGAGKSRVAAALFNAVAPLGWRAVSAGVQPQEHPSEHASALLAGHDAAKFLELDAPRPVRPGEGELVVAIDCDIPGARRWRLAHEWPDPHVRDELSVFVTDLAAELSRITQ